VARQFGSPTLQTFCLNQLARLATAAGDTERLRAWSREGLDLSWQGGEMNRLVPAMHRVAALALARSEPARALRLIAAAGALETKHGRVTLLDEHGFRDELVSRARVDLDEREFAAALAAGAAVPVEQVVRDALAWAASLSPAG
jgi:hypothetical protein